MSTKYPSLKGFDSEDAAWDLEIGLDQVAAIFAMAGWPLIDGPATTDRIEKMIDLLVKHLAEAPSQPLLTYGGRLTVRRNPSAPSCLELSLDFGHLDFSEALEERDGA